jgi:hypothetical protein
MQILYNTFFFFKSIIYTLKFSFFIWKLFRRNENKEKIKSNKKRKKNESINIYFNLRFFHFYLNKWIKYKWMILIIHFFYEKKF